MKYVTWLIIFISLISCSSKPKITHHLDEQISFIENPKNGLVKGKECELNTIEIKYKPIQQLVLQEFKSKNIDSNKIDSLENLYSKNIYFLVTIRPKDGLSLYAPLANENNYYKLIQTLSFCMNDYVSLIIDQNCIKPKYVFFDQIFGMTNSLSFMLVFNRFNLNNTKSFSIYIKEFGLKTGNNSFEFTKSAIDNCPKLVFLNKKEFK